MNEAFENDLFSQSFNILTYLGQWRIDSKSALKNKLYVLYKVVIFIYGWNLVVLGVIDLYQSRHDFKKAAFNMCTTTLIFGITIKNFHLMLLSSRLNHLRFNLFKDGWYQTEPEDIVIKERSRHAYKNRQNIFFSATYTLLPLWLLTSLFSLIWGPRELPFPVYLPLDLDDNFQFAFGFVYHTVGSTFIVLETIHADLGMFALMIQIAAQYEILSKNILKIDKVLEKRQIGMEEKGKWRSEPNDILLSRRTRLMLKKCIQRNLELLMYVKELEYCYNKPMMIQLISGFLLSIGNGLELIVVSVNFSFKLSYQVGYTFIILGDVFMVCTLADLLISQSQEVVKTLYNIAWYDMDNGIKRDILLMMTGAQKIVPMTAGKMFKLSLPTFLGMTKNVYSWLALFRQVLLKK